MKKSDLIIIGAGNVGGFIVNNMDLFDHKFNILGFLDDDETKVNQVFWDFKVLGNVNMIGNLEGASVALGIAAPLAKRKVFERIDPDKYHFPTFVSRNAWLSSDVHVGKGSIIYPGVCVNYNSRIEDFVVINMNCALGHHSVISSFSALAPGVNFGGHTTLEECVDMGIGSSTIQGIHIGKNSIIGGQSMLIKDVGPNSKVVGVPGKILS